MKIVILPGLDGTGRLLKDFASELGAAHDIEVITYPVELISYPDICDWLSTRLPQDDYAVVAESFSGPIAIKIASQNPKTLKALILVATFVRSPRAAPLGLLKVLASLPYFPDLVAWASLPFVMGQAPSRDFMVAYRSALREVTLPMLFGRLQAVLKVDVRDSMREIRLPSAYIRATADRLVPASISAELKQHCDLIYEIAAPHFVLQAKPGEAASIVLNFLAKHCEPFPPLTAHTAQETTTPCKSSTV